MEKHKCLHFFESNMDLACFASLDGYFIEVNDSFENILGYSKKEMFDKPFLEFIHPDDIEASLLELDKVKNGGTVLNFVNRFRAKNGNNIFIEWSAIINPSTNQIFAVGRDISERFTHKDQLNILIEKLTIQNSQLKEFNYILAHNIRGHFSNILMLIDILKTQHNNTEIESIINHLELTSININETLHEILKASEIKSKLLELEHLNISNILKKVQNLLSIEFGLKGIEISIETENTHALGYSIYMESICYNILSNALKYADPNRPAKIKVYAKNADPFVKLYFEDNGLGIDLSKYGSKIFGLQKTFHSHPDAKGFGLYMVKNQLEAMGGNITVESTPNVGSTFIVTLRSPDSEASPHEIT